MAKNKPTPKLNKSKAKTSKSVKSDKKDDKKNAKKPILKAVASTLEKMKKTISDTVSKKTDKKSATLGKAATKGVNSEKVSAKANLKTQELAASNKPQKGPKTDAKSSKLKAKKTDKKAEETFDDDLIGDDFGDNEIAEYEEDLKAVEDDEDDTAALEVSEDEEDEKKDEEVYLTDSEGRRLCKVRDCDQVANVDEYCRFHYLLLWKKIQIRKSILNDGKLEKYVEDLTSRYPDKFLDVIKKDLKSEKDFMAVIHEMELDENNLNEIENEDEVQSFADEIRGIGEAPSLDDDGDY